MTLEQLMASPAEMEAMSDEQLLAYFAPYIKFSRPDPEAIKKAQAKPTSIGSGNVKSGMFRGMANADAERVRKIMEAAAKLQQQGKLPI